VIGHKSFNVSAGHGEYGWKRFLYLVWKQFCLERNNGNNFDI